MKDRLRPKIQLIEAHHVRRHFWSQVANPDVCVVPAYVTWGPRRSFVDHLARNIRRDFSLIIPIVIYRSLHAREIGARNLQREQAGPM